MNWNYNDGGRKQAGFKGETNDCVVRAVAIVTGKAYKEVYDELNESMQAWSNRKLFNPLVKGAKSIRNGVPKKITKQCLEGLGFIWTPTMGIGTGCKVHLRADELPKGKIICNTSKHVVAVIDGVIQDTHDPSRNGNRCVYGYWMLP